MNSIFDEITSFFSGPSVEKCSKEEKKENDKHNVKVNEENERHKIALNKIKENASCKLKYTGSIDTSDIGLELKQPSKQQQPLEQEQEQQ